MELKPEEITKIIRSQIKNYENKIEVSETGVVILVGDGIAFLDALVRSQDDDGDGVLFQVLCHAVGAVGEFHKFTGHALVKTGGLGNAVTDQDDNTGFTYFNFVFVVLI